MGEGDSQRAVGATTAVVVAAAAAVAGGDGMIAVTVWCAVAQPAGVAVAVVCWCCWSVAACWYPVRAADDARLFAV